MHTHVSQQKHDTLAQRTWPNVSLLFIQRSLGWLNSKPILDQRLMFAGLLVYEKGRGYRDREPL